MAAATKSTAVELPSMNIQTLDIPIVTVLLSSKPLCIGEVAERSNALLIAFNGGMFGGGAAAEVICGCFSPVGRLPLHEVLDLRAPGAQLRVVAQVVRRLPGDEAGQHQ